MARKLYSKWRKSTLLFAALILAYHIGRQSRYFTISPKTLKSRKKDDHHYGQEGQERESDRARMDKVKTRLDLRRENLVKVCNEKYLPRQNDELGVAYVKNRYLKTSLFFSNKYKILFCQIPKCGTRSQARFLASIDELVNQDDASTLSEDRVTTLIRRRLSARFADSLEEVVNKISEYTTVVVVRDPLSRLLSAFRNKLENNTREDSYATLAARLHRTYGNGTGERVGRAPVITLDDFLSFLVEEPRSQHDQHWNFYHRLCSPCTIHYQYILHLDTIEEEMEYIISRFGIQVPFPVGSYNSYPDKMQVQKYFAEADPLVVQKVIQAYELDFDLFGFSPLRF